MARLGKAQVEALLATYDATPIDTLTIALRVVLEAPTMQWSALLDLADFDDDRRRRLHLGDQAALDELAAELNEVREVAARTPPSPRAGADDCAPPTGTSHH